MKYLLPLILLTLNFSGSLGCSCAHAGETREAQVYRCGKDGRDLRDSPCPESPGKPASSVRYDQPDSADVHEARERARNVAHEADALERKRLATEAQARKQAATAGSFSAPKAASAPQSAQPQVIHPHKPPKARKPRPAPAASAPR